ncbi:iron-regulated protein A precursor [Flavobacterium akiainvivens]|uniref:Iron-regulated protein A n=1 Tax=Flavobacterium akiainvivens TaxID=1202724 RepID=A0A0M8MDR2_9FLAO|nr:imelysin family protein [Flavobacterium akiainvivens]KOS08085.1 iron-regulated protein A precursor [Flavobacterium akiainvivens]SFQ71678.1 Imelysin [Flavobacterium akiainvivens]
MKRFVLTLSVVAGLLAGCSSSDNNTTSEGTYDRTALMTNWADNIIIPSFEDYQAKANVLNTKAAAFAQNHTQQTLEEVRTAWLDAYKAFQHVGIFDDPKAFELHLIEGSNTYPTDVTGINNNIASGNYNLAQPVQYTREGFPALDYLLYGIGDTDNGLISYYETTPNARQYVADLAAHIKSVADAIVADWNGSYRETFIAGTGTAVSAPINQTVNNFVKNLEKDTRTPKLGIPAGLFSNGVTYADKVEAYYNNNVSRQLLIEALTASKDFFNGKHFGMSANGPGLGAYLDAVNAVREGQNLSAVINAKYDAALAAVNQLNNSFSSQVTADNTKMVNAYNAVQQIVIAEKLDMLQALNISIDYVDGDGD